MLLHCWLVRLFLAVCSQLMSCSDGSASWSVQPQPLQAVLISSLCYKVGPLQLCLLDFNYTPLTAVISTANPGNGVTNQLSYLVGLTLCLFLHAIIRHPDCLSLHVRSISWLLATPSMCYIYICMICMICTYNHIYISVIVHYIYIYVCVCMYLFT